MIYDDFNLLSGTFGLEKENVRVDLNGKLSEERHPSIFKNSNPYITRDFSESQIEMVTPPLPTIDATYDFLNEIEKVVAFSLADEFLWPQSNPPILPQEDKILVAREQGEQGENYRKYLAKKYGAQKSIISGVHFNFSFSDEFMIDLQKNSEKIQEMDKLKEQTYLKVSKYLMKYRWFFIYLLGASPVFHETYDAKCVEQANRNKAGDCTFNGMHSLRSSACGYRNEEHLALNYTSHVTYKQSIQEYIDKNIIAQETELYSAVRIKEDPFQQLYLELRFLDVNPLFENGINKLDLKMLHLFAIYFAHLEDFDFDKKQQLEAAINHDNVAILDEDIIHIMSNGEKKTLQEEGDTLLRNIREFYSKFKNVDYPLDEIIDLAHTKIFNVKETYGYQIKNMIEQSNYIDFHLYQAKKFKANMMKDFFSFKGHEDMELSTQILMQAAIKKGILYEILDKKENFIRFINPINKQKEYVKSATKTSADKYSQVLVMENKNITKKVLEENHFCVPKGCQVNSEEEAMSLYTRMLLPSKLVIKPNTTNFGEGITIFTEQYSKKQFEEATQIAFSKDKTILLEEFLEGKEYRFLVIKDEVVGILHRRPANVKGDGIHTITELVKIKNKSYLRGTNYQKPLEKIQLGSAEVAFLKNQNLTLDDVLSVDKVIYLRENSNISTGGDSLDYTDQMDETYKQIAIQVAQSLDVKICGIDIMIQNYKVEANDTNYGIIEANFNPAIHIHCFPYQGENRKVGEKILDLLFF